MFATVYTDYYIFIMEFYTLLCSCMVLMAIMFYVFVMVKLVIYQTR